MRAILKAVSVQVFVAVPLSLAHAETPKLFLEREFSSADLAHAANHFVNLGEQESIKVWIELAAHRSRRQQREQGFDVVERIGWICRIIYTPKEGRAISPPAFGGLMLPYRTMPSRDWPLYPVVRSGQTFFVLSEGYMVAGNPEQLQDFLNRCRANGMSRKSNVEIVSREQARKDADLLRASKQWKAIRWKDKGLGFSYDFDEETVWRFVKVQADSIE